MKIKEICFVSLFAALTSLGALYSIPLPFSPVPITLQSLVTLLAGLLLGSRLGMLSQVVYVALGAAGLPIFSKGQAGIGVFLGPSGGYLLGFIAAAYLVGKLTEGREDCSLGRLVLVFLVATVIIYILGLGRLMMVTGLPFSQALMAGVIYFIPGDILKITFSSLVGWRVYRVLVTAKLKV